MDRRRFVPSTEGLESRKLLSLFGAPQTNKHTDQNVPLTFFQKEARVDHLPFYLDQAETSRFLPATTVKTLQTDLDNLIGTIHTSSEPAVKWFGEVIRDGFRDATLSPAEASTLNHAFGKVLTDAGATPAQTVQLQSDMNQLAFVDSKSVNPTILAVNDYSIVLQTALAVGRPIKQPEAPVLHKNDGTTLDGGKLGRTRDHNPTLVGVYNVGIKGNGITYIQVVTANGQVLGGSSIAKYTGDYAVGITTPLPDGVYDLYTRAIDNQGHVSDLSFHYFELKVYTPGVKDVTTTTTVTPPSGPLSLIGK